MVAEIGDRVGLSSTPCWKRIQRLEADGVILRRVALVEAAELGRDRLADLLPLRTRLEALEVTVRTGRTWSTALRTGLGSSAARPTR